MNHKLPLDLLRHAVIATVLVAAPFAVHAQTKAAAAAAGAPAAAPTAPPPVNVTPEARAAIKELLDAMNTRDQLSKAFVAIGQTLAPRMADGMNRQIEAYPGLSADQKVKVRQAMNGPFEAAVKDASGVVNDPKLVDETYEKMIPIYASHFTTPDIKQIAAFYKSPVGQKALVLVPQSNGEALQLAANVFSPRINAIMEKTVKTQADAVMASSGPAPAKK
jgi:hypothetical protein